MMKYFNKEISRILVSLLIFIFLSGISAGLYGAPYVTTLPPTNVMSNSATLQGEVNPNGLPTQAFFSSADPVTSPSFFSTTQNINAGDAITPVPVNWTLTGLMPGTTYNYTVSANNGAGGKVGAKVTFTTLSTPPSPPQTPIATASSSSITINWNLPTSNGGSLITSYKIFRSTTSGGETFYATSNILTYTDTSVSGGQTYYYKVSAVNSAGEGVMSIEAPATVPLAPTTTVTVTVIPTTTATATVTAPPLAPLTVIVTSDSGSIGIGMTSEIKVTVLSDNKEISGADVMVSSSSGGRINPGSGTTDLFGQFISTFTGAMEGIVSVRAIVRKSGFEDGKGAVQITVGPAQTPVITPNTSQIIQQKSYLKNANGNATKNDNITVPGEEDKTSAISGIKPESGFVVDISIILYIVAFAGIIFLIYWKMKVKSKEEKTIKESVKKRICSNCGTENFGDNNFCEKCGKSLKP